MLRLGTVFSFDSIHPCNEAMASDVYNRIHIVSETNLSDIFVFSESH